MNVAFSNSIMRNTALVVLSVLAATTLGAALVGAASTISTNISTGGTLTVTGASTLTGAVTASDTLAVTGAVTTAGAVTLGDAVTDAITATGYFTQLRIGTGSTFTNIGTVGADELGVEGAMEVDGAAYFTAAVTLASTLSVTSATSTLATTTVARLLTVGTTTPMEARADVIFDGAGTTTLWITSSTNTAAGCIQMENALGAPVRLYVTTGTALRVEVGTCK
jgi:hypothetical protein